MNFFIDTNVLLAFYHLTSEDLEELRKLGVLLREDRAKLLLPDQVLDEFRRNRETKIADALKRLRDQHLNLQFPQLCKDYDEYDRLRDLQREYQAGHEALLARIEADVENETLKADEVISELFQHVEVIATHPAMLARARERVDRGNPPGKRGSVGDAINWEALITAVPDAEDLFLITDDKDFASALNPERLDQYLAKEWREKKGSDIHYYRRVSEFFRDRFPDIRLASELEKDLLIRDLANSGSFAETHAIVARLSRVREFTNAQRNAIVNAAISNDQIYWIIEDYDVDEFLRETIEGHEEDLDPSNLHELRRLMQSSEEEDEEEEEDDLPF